MIVRQPCASNLLFFFSSKYAGDRYSGRYSPTLDKIRACAQQLAARTMSRGFTHRKRRAGGSDEPEYDEGIELIDLRRQVETLTMEKEALNTPFRVSGATPLVTP